MNIGSRALSLIAAMTLPLLSGCFHYTYPEKDVNLRPAQMGSVKTLEVIVIGNEKPFSVERQYYNDADTLALRQVGGAGGGIAASIISSTANKKYAAEAASIAKQMEPVQDQVRDINYLELTKRAVAEQLKTGQIEITKLTTQVVDNSAKQFRFLYSGGINDYAASAQADAVMVVLPSLEFSSYNTLTLKQSTRVWMVAKDGRTLYFGTVTHNGEAPEKGMGLNEKVSWWSQDNRYRNVVLNSVDSTIEYINRKVFDDYVP